MRKCFIAAAILLSLAISIPAFSQGGFATVTGSVSDTTGALIPGVMITAKDVDTGVVTTTISNDTGAYNFPSLLPGKYTLTAALTGLTTQTITDAALGGATSYRYNFKMGVSTASTTQDVVISAQTMLATSGATIGQALSEQKVRDLPLVGNNVLSLIGTLSGVENIQNGAFNRELTTFAGVSAQNIATVRDGVIVSDTRYPTGINSATVINPDLVGEVRLILAPVDAELGRGNGTVQITTRSGTNKYTGSAVWSARNSAFNPNSWANNANTSVPAGSVAGTLPVATPVNWNNTHQVTGSFGGPIVKNKTFFFVLADFNQALQRGLFNTPVLTPCARLGIVRYFDGWNSNNALANTVLTAGAQSTPSVKLDGTPRTDLVLQPNGAPAALQFRSVFGPLANNPTDQVNCSDAPVSAATLKPTSTTGTWDPNRVALDTTGFINRTLAYMPQANNWEIGDGLNTAGFRWLRHNTGLDNLFSVGEDTGIRKQINVKIDQNFNAKNKANVNVSYERVHSDDIYEAWPGTFSNSNSHHPLVVTGAFTSTLSASLLNEARVGYKVTGTNLVAPWDRPEYQTDINAYNPPDVNGVRVLARSSPGTLGFCFPITGARPPGACFTTLTNSQTDHTPSWTFGDTLSWTMGNHALKFGFELRENDTTSKVDTTAFFSNFSAFAQAVGGSAPGAPQNINGGVGINNTNPAFSTLLGTTAGNARSVLDFLSGSLTSINQEYWLTTPQSTSFSDYRNEHFITTPLHQTEISSFAKDDYKLTKHLTLNLGVRWEYYGVPYNTRGITVSPIGGSDAVFGISGRDFSKFWNAPAPGSSGTSTATAYDPSLLTAEQFVGPKSPNSSTGLYKDDWNNFGPSLGFSWQVPWFGEGKTTLRGGYQVTYQGGGRFSTLEPVISFPPGSTNSATYADPTNLYLDMTDLGVAIPVAPTNTPMGTLRVTDRTQTLQVIDSNISSPYVQNLTLALSRQVSRNLTLTTTYIGTLGVKQYSTWSQMNNANFLYNGLAAEFAKIRTGGESPLLDSMFKGINLCFTTCGTAPAGQPFGRIGIDPGQTAAQQMRSSSNFNTNLAQGNWNGVATTINTLNYTKAAAGSACLPSNTAGNCGLPDLPSGLGAVTGSAMRNSGLFPENFIVNNPQYGAINYYTQLGHSNYHSLQVEGTYRPIQGVTMQGTYTFSKNLGLPGTFSNPVDRHEDYSIVNSNRPQTLRTNAVFELPIGPNKLLFGNTSGAVARLIERWQVSILYNYNTGGYSTIGANSQLYANGTPDVVWTPYTQTALDILNHGDVKWGTRKSSTTSPGLEGRYWGDNFATIVDPQCGTVTPLQNLNGLNTTGVPVNRCTMRALVYIVPDGTPGAITINDTVPVQNPAFPDQPSNIVNAPRTRSGVIVLQNAQPGTRGSLGQNTARGIGSYALDANISKQFRISESKSIQVRIDTTNVLNHPTPGAPSFSINQTTAPIGQLTTKSGGRQFQGQLRFSF